MRSRAFPRRRETGRGSRFGPSPLERARERLGTPADVLARHGVTVRRRMAVCPLHEDRTPSLSLYRGKDGRERWKCHGCDRGGDALDLEAALSGRDVRDLIA
jgi:hypothetical protein